jgi:hypothetical protein
LIPNFIASFRTSIPLAQKSEEKFPRPELPVHFSGTSGRPVLPANFPANYRPYFRKQLFARSNAPGWF